MVTRIRPRKKAVAGTIAQSPAGIVGQAGEHQPAPGRHFARDLPRQLLQRVEEDVRDHDAELSRHRFWIRKPPLDAPGRDAVQVDGVYEDLILMAVLF